MLLLMLMLVEVLVLMVVLVDGGGEGAVGVHLRALLARWVETRHAPSRHR